MSEDSEADVAAIREVIARQFASISWSAEQRPDWVASGRPFNVVMTGIGVIAVGGIIVHNNIVLIDTYNDLRRKGKEAYDAALTTGVLRMRPVILTSINDIIGLSPMLFAMNVDFINRSITFGSPSTQWWTDLSIAIAGGLAFATFLTLVLTPCLLILGERLSAFWRTHVVGRPVAEGVSP